MCRSRHIGITAAAAASAVALAACGSAAHFANVPRPPIPSDVTVYVDNNHVAISPDHFGGGPVLMLVTNEATSSETVDIQQDGKSVATSHAIDSGQTAQIKTSLNQGTYVATAGAKIATAKISVGKERPNADNQLLQP